MGGANGDQNEAWNSIPGRRGRALVKVAEVRRDSHGWSQRRPRRGLELTPGEIGRRALVEMITDRKECGTGGDGHEWRHEGAPGK